MAQRLPTKFDKYEFAETEFFTLSDLQRQWITHLLSLDAEQRLALDVDPTNIMAFVQTEAYFKARQEFAQSLLDLADSHMQMYLQSTSNSGETK